MTISRFQILGRAGLAALVAAGLAGCGGGGGGDGDGGGTPTPQTNFDGAVQVGGGSITGVTIKSPPVISFKLQDSTGNPVLPTGLVAARVALAKYVAGSPDRWVPFGAKAANVHTEPGKFMVSNENRSCGQTGDGWAFANVKYDSSTAVYTYHFCTDVTTHPDWDAAATYRIGAELQFTNTPTAKIVTSNPIADFTLVNGVGQQLKDSSGNGRLVRNMVDRQACNSCHHDLGQQSKFHGNRRIDPNYCVLCHNDSAYDPKTAESLDMKTMVHKFHMGSHLTGSYAPSGLDATKMHYSQDQRNCTKCHTETAIEGNQHATAQGDNWKKVPSRNACGSCHDGINFATGGGTTLNPSNPWASLGHVGGAQADDSKCVLCHSADAVAKVYHLPITTVTSTSSSSLGAVTHYASNDGRLPTGAVTVDYDIMSVSLNASRNPVMVFRLLQNGARMDLRAASSTTDDAIWSNFSGAPTVYFAYSVPQDGIEAPADFNAYVNASLLGIWNGSATGTSAGTLSAPDSSGYYTVTLTGRTIPANASLLTGAMGYAAMYQTNVAGYARTCSSSIKTNCVNGLNVTAQDMSKTATGFTARRITADADKCNNCHGKLGLFAESTFHSGQRNDPKMCAMCHNPNRTSSGWSADSTSFIHGTHAAAKRAVPFNWHKDAAFDATVIGYPGILKNCEACHAPGGYDFSAGGSQVGSRLYRTTATATSNGLFTDISKSPYVDTNNTIYGTGYNSSDAAATTPSSTTTGLNLVNSPIANACFGCHDGIMSSTGSPVKDHIEQLGVGSIYMNRTAALGRSEQCMACHSPTGIVPIKAAHGK